MNAMAADDTRVCEKTAVVDLEEIRHDMHGCRNFDTAPDLGAKHFEKFRQEERRI